MIDKIEVKDGKVSTETRLMLKHTATEVVEAAEAYNSITACMEKNYKRAIREGDK